MLFFFNLKLRKVFLIHKEKYLMCKDALSFVLLAYMRGSFFCKIITRG